MCQLSAIIDQLVGPRGGPASDCPLGQRAASWDKQPGWGTLDPQRRLCPTSSQARDPNPAPPCLLWLSDAWSCGPHLAHWAILPHVRRLLLPWRPCAVLCASRRQLADAPWASDVVGFLCGCLPLGHSHERCYATLQYTTPDITFTEKRAAVARPGAWEIGVNVGELDGHG